MYTIIDGLPYFVNDKEKCLHPIVVTSLGVTIHTDKKVKKEVGSYYTLSLLQHVLGLETEETEENGVKLKKSNKVITSVPEETEETVEKAEKTQTKAKTTRRKTAKGKA